MIRLHATLGSVNGYKVRLLLSMLELEYELVELDMYGGEHKREPFLSLNPFGQMPALEDGEFVIADSHPCRTRWACQLLLPTTTASEGVPKKLCW